MADYETIRWYNEWASELRNEVRSDGPVTIDRVGKLSKNLSGEILFDAERPIQTFLEPVAATRVIRTEASHKVLVGDRELSNKDAASYLHEEHLVEKESWWLYVWIIIAVSLVVLFFHFYKNGFTANAVGNQKTIRVSK